MSKNKKINKFITSAMIGVFIFPNIAPITTFAEDTKAEVLATNNVQTVYDFYQTGDVQEFIAPFDGVYLLEAWGAEGGDNNIKGMSDTYSNNGAYAKGQYKMAKGEKLYVYVGSKGQDEMSDKNAHTNLNNNAGWNGGGSGKGAGSGGGGGATDFRTEFQDVNTEFVTGSVDDKRVLVAGGGGGHSPTQTIYSTVYSALMQGISGGNTYARCFYPGGNAQAGLKLSYISDTLVTSNKGETATKETGGGGGGYYSGKGSVASQGTYTQSIVNGVGGTNTIRGVGAGTELTGVVSIPHPAGGTQTGNSGHGYARITLLNNAPELVLTNNLRSGMEIEPNQELTINGTINDEIGNEMMVYYQLDDNAPIKIFTTPTKFEPVVFDENITMPSALTEGKHIISIWSEDDAGAIGKRTQYNMYYIVDKNQQTLQNIKLTPNEWTKNNVTITLDVNDNLPIEKVILPDNRAITDRQIAYTATANGNFLFKAQTYTGEEYETIVTVENIDKTVPTINHTLDRTSFSNSTVTINVNVTDLASGVSQIILPNGNIVRDANTVEYEVTANGTYTFKAIDVAGNEISKNIVISNIDKEVPTLNLSKNTTAVASKVTITASSSSLSGIEKIILPDGKEVKASSTTFIATENRDYTFRVINNVGAITEQTITIDNIENVLPTVELDYNKEWTNKDIVVSVVANDSNSGVANIRMPNGTTVTGGYGMYTITANGTYNFTVTDNAGNVTVKTITINNIDKTAPTYTSFVTPSVWSKEDALISLSVLDAGVGLDKIILPNGDEVIETPRYEYTVNANGNYIFTLIDKLGNSQDISIPVTKVDKESPNVTVLDLQISSTNLGVSIQPTDIASGLSRYEFIAPNNEIFKPTLSGGKATVNLNRTLEQYNGEWTLKAYDIAGNVAQKTKTVTEFDGTPPTLTLTAMNINDGEKLITAIAEDNNSGLQSIKTPDGQIHTGKPMVQYTVRTNGTFSFEALDKFGNKVVETIKLGDVVNNNTALNLTLNNSDWTNSDVVISATIVNPSSPIKYIKLPNGNMVKANAVAYLVKSNGAYIFEAEDELGITYRNAIVVSNIDKGAPVIEIINETEWTNQNVDVTINAEDK